MGDPEGSGVVDGLRVRVTDLRRHVGDRLDEVRAVWVRPHRVGDAEVADGPVTVTLGLESLSDGVRVEGSVDFGWTGSCRRCLDAAHGRGHTDFRELFVDDPERYAGSDDEEVHPIDQGWVDLGVVVHDAVLLGLPLAPLCGPDCPGPDPDHFPVSVERATTPAEEPVDSTEALAPDPRWAVLSELRFDPRED